MRACLTLFSLLLVWSSASGENSLAEEVATADSEYRNILNDLSARAKKTGDLELAGQIDHRLTYINRFPLPKDCAKDRTLTITGSMKGYAELSIGKNGLSWHDLAHLAGPDNVTVNGVPWPVNLTPGHNDNVLEVPIQEIIKWKASGTRIVVTRIPRGPNTSGFKIACRNASTRENFTLLLHFR